METRLCPLRINEHTFFGFNFLKILITDSDISHDFALEIIISEFFQDRFYKENNLRKISQKTSVYDLMDARHKKPHFSSYRKQLLYFLEPFFKFTMS